MGHKGRWRRWMSSSGPALFVFVARGLIGPARRAKNRRPTLEYPNRVRICPESHENSLIRTKSPPGRMGRVRRASSKGYCTDASSFRCCKMLSEHVVTEASPRKKGDRGSSRRRSQTGERNGGGMAS